MLCYVDVDGASLTECFFMFIYIFVTVIKNGYFDYPCRFKNIADFQINLVSSYKFNYGSVKLEMLICK